MAVWPKCSAHPAGVALKPSSVTAGLAPRETRRRTVSKAPCLTASWSAVVAFFALTSQPCSTSRE
jgi:hypothetical protein